MVDNKILENESKQSSARERLESGFLDRCENGSWGGLSCGYNILTVSVKALLLEPSL